MFGGTSEGRELAKALSERGIPVLMCVATEYGQLCARECGTARVNAQRLDEKLLCSLLALEKPRVVIDATHPYAEKIGENIVNACNALGLRRIRVKRRALEQSGCVRFDDLEALVDWLCGVSGVIFSTLGIKRACALARIPDFAGRVWLRVLPCAESLNAALSAGFMPKRIICMQGPFSRELNQAMFAYAGARVLVTKESGAAGGFEEKLAAANALGMTVAVLERPADTDGVELSDLIRVIEEGGL